MATQIYKIPLDLDDISRSVFFQLLDTPGAGQYFPDEVMGGSSMTLEFTFTNSGVPSSFSGSATFNIYGKPDETVLSKELLGTGSAIANVVTFTIDKDKIKNEWSQYTSSDWPVTITIEIIDGTKQIIRKARIRVIDADGIGTGGALSIDASEILYIPTTPTDWSFLTSAPTNDAEALDGLAQEITRLENDKADKANVLELDNTDPFTPSADYHPATFKFVNDALASLSSGVTYLGAFNANTSIPSLQNGSGSTGDFYRVTVAGAHNFGSGSVALEVGDTVIYNGSNWNILETSGSSASEVVNDSTVSGSFVSDALDWLKSNIPSQPEAEGGSDNSKFMTALRVAQLLAATGLVKNNIAGGSAPSFTDDLNSGYSAGSIWIHLNTDAYICLDASIGAAQWAVMTLTTSGEANTNSNSGTGQGIVLPKVGVNTPLKSFLVTGGLILNPLANELQIDSSALMPKDLEQSDQTAAAYTTNAAQKAQLVTINHDVTVAALVPNIQMVIVNTDSSSHDLLVSGVTLYGNESKTTIKADGGMVSLIWLTSSLVLVKGDLV